MAEVYRIDNDDIYVLLDNTIRLFSTNQLIDWPEELCSTTLDDYLLYLFEQLYSLQMQETQRVFDELYLNSPKRWAKLPPHQRLDMASISFPTERGLKLLESKFALFCEQNSNINVIAL